MKSNIWILVAVGVGVLLVFPTVVSQPLINAGIQMLIAALFASAFNLLCGQAGMLSFGHAAYFGVGTFATIHAMNAFGGVGILPTPLMPLAGAAIGLLTGIAAGWFATQRTGTYFAMITLALAELLHALAPHLKGVFGGEAGIYAMRMPAWGLTFGSSTEVYYLTLVWVLLSLLLLYLFTLTPMGRLSLGLRENSHRLKFLGYDVHRLNATVFAISAMFSGVAGGLQALHTESANYVLLEGHVSAAVVLNSYIGGVSAFLGPALGAALMTFFGYAVSDLTRSWLLYQGVLFVLVMMFMPTGLIGFFKWLSTSRRTHGTAPLLPLLCIGLLSGLFLTAGTVFAVEMLQRFFSLDYRSMTAMNPGAGWAPIMLFGRDWLPNTIGTWILPLGLWVVGGALTRQVARMWRSLADRDEQIRVKHEAAVQGDAR